MSIKAKHRASGTDTTVPRPSIEPIIFLCRADALPVMARRRVRMMIVMKHQLNIFITRESVILNFDSILNNDLIIILT